MKTVKSGGEAVKLVIMGAGQQGAICKRLAEENGYHVCAFIDDFKSGCVDGIPVYRNITDIEDFMQYRYFVAVGKIEYRKKFIDIIEQYKLGSVNLIDRNALIEEGAQMGTGNYIYKLAVVYASARIGNHNIVNCKALLGADSVIGDNNNISLGSNVCGEVVVGNNCYVGAQSTIVSGFSIGDDVKVVEGSAVLSDIPSGCTVSGVPARPV